MTTMLRVGDWRVDPASGQISKGDQTVRLEARTMRLLICLAEHAGEVVSIDDLLRDVWSGVIVTPDSVYQAVASLRRLLGDDSKKPAYIANVPRLGYRMVAAVSPWSETAPKPGLGKRFAWGAGAAAVLGIAAFAFLFHGGTSPAAAPRPPKSVAVLPFLDLTEGMKEEEFADGMTEELIDKLIKVPGLRVPAPTASFYFKNKHLKVADVAKSLRVAYVVDGSVRKSGGRLRVAARLIHAEDGDVMWSESYDRPWGDVLIVQDDIAGKVTSALRTSIR
jgi:transcriptional activator of cad operon